MSDSDEGKIDDLQILAKMLGGDVRGFAYGSAWSILRELIQERMGEMEQLERERDALIKALARAYEERK